MVLDTAKPKGLTPILPMVFSSVLALSVSASWCPAVSAKELIADTPRALLIGINDYQNLPPLNGALNDVAAVKNILMSRHGFAADNITMLTDHAATRAGILAALSALAVSTRPGDTVYIHYSGHGSQVKDLDGDEADAMDETISPQDSRTEGIADITDDELDRAFALIRSRRLIITLDSCHSGTGLRGGTATIRQRFVPPDTRLHLYAGNAVRTRAVVPLPTGEDYILFTGAAAHQSALDGPFNAGRYHGLFTYAYTQALGRLPTDASPRQIMAEVAVEIEALHSALGGYLAPEPQLEGPIERLDNPLLEPIVPTSAQVLGEAAQMTAEVLVQQLFPEHSKLSTRGGKTLFSAARSKDKQRLTVTQSVQFGLGSAVLPSSAKAFLNELAIALRSSASQGNRLLIVASANTGEAPVAQQTLALAEQRAVSIKDYLLQSPGVEPSRLQVAGRIEPVSKFAKALPGTGTVLFQTLRP